MQKVQQKNSADNGKIISIYIIILTKPRDGTVIPFIECGDTTQKGYLRWNKGSVPNLKIVTGKPFIQDTWENNTLKKIVMDIYQRQENGSKLLKINKDPYGL